MTTLLAADVFTRTSTGEAVTFWLLGTLCFVMPVFALFIIPVKHAPAPKAPAK